MPLILALANQKGGVGKTTTAINLGAYLVYFGKRVLLVDVDPQANATSSLGVNAANPTIYEALINDLSMNEIVTTTKFPQLDLIPSARALAGGEIELVHLPQREYRLKQALATLQEQYDYVFIDTPPSLGLMTINGLTAAQGVIIPVQCEYLSLEGLTHLVQTIALVRRRLNPGLRIFGLVMTMFDGRTNLSSQVVEEVRKHFGDKVFRTVIPRSVRLSEAPSFGEPIIAYAPKSPGGLAYEHLAQEVLERTEQVVSPETMGG